MAQDLYSVLGVDKKATQDEIKKAYRKLARENHPDRNAGDAAAEERFKEIQGAYDILSDPEKRREYDSGGPLGFDPRNFAGGAAQNLGDIFSFFTRGRGGAQMPGNDLETDVSLTFDQAMSGTEITVTVPEAGGVHHLRRLGRQARHGASHLPAVPWAVASTPRARASSRSRSPVRSAAAAARSSTTRAQRARAPASRCSASATA